MRREAGACSRIAIGEAIAWKFFTGRAYVAGVGREVAEFAFKAGSPREERCVAEGAIDSAQVQCADGATGRDGGEGPFS